MTGYWQGRPSALGFWLGTYENVYVFEHSEQFVLDRFVAAHDDEGRERTDGA